MNDDDLRVIYARLIAVETLARAAASAVSDRAALREAFREASEIMTVHLLNLPHPEIYRSEYEKAVGAMRRQLGLVDDQSPTE